jgi:cysteine desulfurase
MCRRTIEAPSINRSMIYLDHHATTPCDVRVVEAMLPWMTTHFGNPHSHTHAMGRHAAQACDTAIGSIAHSIGGDADAVIVTSGATESNNLAIDGVMRHPRQKRRHIITAATEHPAVLDPIARLQRDGFRVTILPVKQQDDPQCGRIDPQQLRDSIDGDTGLVSIMWANNELGTIESIPQIAEIAHQAGALFHTDATQALGRLNVDVVGMEIDLLSGSAHKFYGPKGIGFLYAGSAKRRVRLRPLVEGGGQQRGLRSGTLNTAGVIGMARALEICIAEMEDQENRLAGLRDQLWARLISAFPAVELNGPPFNRDLRLAGNLNVSLSDVEGESIMATAQDLAISSGAACSSVDPRPSHVLTAIGLSESRARRSLRFGLGRGTTSDQIDSAIDMLIAGHRKLVNNGGRID